MKLIIKEEVILQITYDDCSKKSGGVNKLIRAHQKLITANGKSCLCIFPINLINKLKWPRNEWGIVLDGEFLYTLNSIQIIQLFCILKNSGIKILDVYVHHMYGIDIRELENILDCINTRILFYVHDNYGLCPSFNLMKNDKYFCGNAEIYRIKCCDCRYYEDAAKQRKTLISFIKKYNQRLLIVVPSEYTKSLWIKSLEKIIENIVVIEHQKYDLKQIQQKKFDQKSLKVAYAGVGLPHKGWDEWKKITRELYCEGKNYQFYYYGITKCEMSYVMKKYVDVKLDPEAMIKALIEDDIDIVVLWSLCPETYSYTYYEAFAAGTFVLTFKDSGNIAEQVRNNQNGIVFNNIEEATNWLKREELVRNVINEYRNSGKLIPYNLHTNVNKLFEWSKHDTSIKSVIIKRSKLSRFICTLYFLKCKIGR